MIRPWEKFAVVQGQVTVNSLIVTRRSRGFIACTLDVDQKYPEVRSWSGMEVHLGTSEHTPARQLLPDSHATTVVYPLRVRGWDLTYNTGNYYVDLVLRKPSRIGLPVMEERDENWRVAQFTEAKR